jgi:hypothetical protein
LKRLFLVFLALSGLIAFGQSQESSKAGTTAAQFLKIGAGARAMALGGAVSAVVSDPSSLYWNPAGVVDAPQITFLASHTQLFADVKHNFFGCIVPVTENSNLGVSATVLSMGRMEITTELRPQGIGEYFDASDIAIGASYGVRMADFFAFGASAKYISQTIYNESASAVAFDFGTRLYTGFEGIVVGMSYSNFGTTMKLEGRDLRKTYDPNPNNATNVGVTSFLGTESWELPVNFRVGVGWKAMGVGGAYVESDQHALTLEVDANHPNDGPENAIVGMEYIWNELVAVRGAYRFNDDIRTWSYGFGLNWQAAKQFGLGVDFAASAYERLGVVQTLSLVVRF